MKFIFAFGMSALPILLVLYVLSADLSSTGGDLLFVLFVAIALAVLLLPVYAALRTVKINYSLSHTRDLAAGDQAIAAAASAKA